jgi:hypothetical protein
MACRSIPSGNSVLVCIVADKAVTAETVLGMEGTTYTEAEVSQANLPNRPSEFARCFKTRQGKYQACCAIEPGTSFPSVIFWVTEVGRAISHSSFLYVLLQRASPISRMGHHRQEGDLRLPVVVP